MLITLLEIVTLVRETQFRNALAAIFVTVLGKVTTTSETLTGELYPVTLVLVASLKIKKASKIALYNTSEGIPDVVNSPYV